MIQIINGQMSGNLDGGSIDINAKKIAIIKISEICVIDILSFRWHISFSLLLKYLLLKVKLKIIIKPTVGTNKLSLLKSGIILKTDNLRNHSISFGHQ